MLFVEERGYHVLLPRCNPHHTAGSESAPQRHWTHQATPQSDALHIPLELSYTRLLPNPMMHVYT
jgi:hypothetical protein